MKLFLKLFFVVVANLSASWCSTSVRAVDSSSFLFEDGKLTAECFGQDTGEYLSQLATYQSVNKLHLRGFEFDEVNVKQFSATFSELQDLTLIQCDINDELINLLTLPSSLKSIRLERLNLSSKGIQSILEKLSHSLESLEVIDCLVSKLPQQELSANSTSQKDSLDLSKICHLKKIHIDDLKENFDSYQLLLSLSLFPLERIKLSCVYLSNSQWTKLLNEWKGTNGVAFFNTLKEFDLKVGNIDGKPLTQLIQFSFSFPLLEIISFNTNYPKEESISLPLPSNIKQFSVPFKVFMEDGKRSFWNSKNLSQLTHLTINDSFHMFPYNLFELEQLEYLEIWCSNYVDYLSTIDRRCDKLKYLSIQSKYLRHLLYNFENNFPVIETLVVYSTYVDHLFFQLEKILSSKTLKCLEINCDSDRRFYSEIEGGLVSSIEELKLTNIWWKDVSCLFEAEQFPCLKKIHISNIGGLMEFDLKEIFEKLSSIPQLTSLTLKGNFFYIHKKLPVTFKNLRFLRLEVCHPLDLDLLFSYMPNLIELQLEGLNFEVLKLQNPINLRYLKLPFIFSKRSGDYINVIKNIPNLVQLSTQKNEFSQYPIEPFVFELTYYFKKLKEHFNNELQFEINPNCLPIQQLKNDAELMKLVHLKSPQLTNYLNLILPIDTFEPILTTLFTVEIENYFNFQSIDAKLMKIFFNLLRELKVNRMEDVSFMQKLLFEGEKERFTGSTNLTVDDFYKLFSDYLTKSIRINLEPVYLKFVDEFYKENQKHGPLKIHNFLKSFFTSPSVDVGESMISSFFRYFYTYFSTDESQSKIISKEAFDFFSNHVLANSFCLLFDKIKKGELMEEEKKFLSIDYNPLIDNLKNLEQEQYENLSTHFKDVLVEACDESFIKSLFDILKAILISKGNCRFCYNSLFSKECKFFKSKNGNCHLFYRDCLNEWLQNTNSCPLCRVSA